MEKALCKNEIRDDVMKKFIEFLGEYKNDDDAYNALDCAYDLFFALKNLATNFNALKDKHNAMKAEFFAIKAAYHDLLLKHDNE